MQLDLFGVPQIEAGERGDCPLRWPGQYEDAETGLYYNRFRYYDPEGGQYLGQDPIGLAGGFHLNSYVLDPIVHQDPLGLEEYSMRVQLQRGRANLASVPIGSATPITAVQVERAMMQAIQALREGERGLIPSAHGAAAALSKKLREIVAGRGISMGGNILRAWLHDTNVRFDIENSRGHNLQSCK